MTLTAKQLEENFEKNIAFFEKGFPKLAEKFKDFKPSADLILDPDLGINIFDRKKEAFLYPGDGRLITLKQIAYWLENPSFFTLAPAEMDESEGYLHTRYINRLVRLRKELLKTDRLSLTSTIPMSLLIVGVGLGEHLKFLVENLNLENLLILEPNEDFFYISLHYLNWEELIKTFTEKGGLRISILVGEDAKDTDRISGFFSLIGAFKASTTFLYIHYLDEFLKNFVKELGTEVVRNISFFGFFDDEIISLKHTLTNIKNRVPLFNPHSKGLSPDIPAVVVGSGPSLEFLLPYLKRYGDKLFIISCGTALGILEKHGIKPDLHTNIERIPLPYEVALKTTSEEFRKEIPFLGANNNYPPFFGIFKKGAMFLKAGDAGADLFPQEKLYYVNPTVTNTGLALAFYLGFKKVYLFGVDLAFEGKKHHAKGSAYDTLLKDMEKLLKGEIEVEGNFGGKVVTNSIFYSSLKFMGESIKYFKGVRKEFEVFNPNRGAKIEGATPLREEELENHLKELKENKKTFAERFWQETVEPLKEEWFDFPKLKMQLMTNFYQLKMVMDEVLEKTERAEDFAQTVAEFYDYIRVIRNHNPILYHLLHGTLTLFLAHLQFGLFADVPTPQKELYLKEAKKLLREMLQEMEKEIYNLYDYFPF
ncbi:MAG: hypothetical protein DSZ31_05695 [Gammaproteobacteria bacterium]|nr:MAG: hypothetical protein DSZ31_05695 [Gammaproteobacteria bacterium]